MKVLGLDGREYTWKLTGKMVNAGDKRPRSSFHLKARALLREIYPVSPILEEVELPGSGGLRADFYLPQQNRIIEVHGEQHYKFSKHFHGDRRGFLLSQKRDADKTEWCAINNIKYLALPYSESEDVWRALIR